MIEKRVIYFNEELHKYVDQFTNLYTSATTKLDELAPHTDFHAIAESCAKIGKNPMHPKYEKYKGMSKYQLLKKWGQITDTSLVRGNKEHNYLENTVKLANGFKRNYSDESVNIDKYLYKRMYTIHDLATGNLNGIGEVTVESLRASDLHIVYPTIFKLIEALAAKGFKFYPEIVVYHPGVLISGMIDLLAVRDNEFIVIDWKTNKDDIVFKSGYFEKDIDGNSTSTFVEQNKVFKHPIGHVPYSVGHKYSLQLSLYAKFVERFGYTCKGLVIYHITHEQYKLSNGEMGWVTKPVPITYYREEIEMIIDNINLTKSNKKNQFNMFA